MFEWLRKRRERREPDAQTYFLPVRTCGPMCPGCDEASEPIEPAPELRIVGAVPRPRDSRGRFLKAEGHAGAESSVSARSGGSAPTRGRDA